MSFGVLYDPELKGMSAEAIYDLIVTDMRRYRKLGTLRGVGLGDMLEGHTPEWWMHGDGVALDGFYRRCLTQGLASIASYSLSREVGRVRLVFCDAVAYDEGYVAPEAISERVRVRGRGGTVLQPGIDLLERAEDFPKSGPLLIITDGECDRLQVRREHAFLLPQGRHLPFVPKGPVFRII